MYKTYTYIPSKESFHIVHTNIKAMVIAAKEGIYNL